MRYVFDHHTTGEDERLHAMAALLDPFSQYGLRRCGVGPGWTCLEIGAGNGSLSQWLADVVAPDGMVVATDLELALMEGRGGDHLRVERYDVVNDEMPIESPDLVFMRAVIHHLRERRAVLERVAQSVKPGGWVYIEEPDFTFGELVEPESQRAFWTEFMEWAGTAGIDYRTGHHLAQWMDKAGLVDIACDIRTPIYHGGSTFAQYLDTSVGMLGDKLTAHGIDSALLEEFHRLHHDPSHWTRPLSFVACAGRRPIPTVGSELLSHPGTPANGQ